MKFKLKARFKKSLTIDRANYAVLSDFKNGVSYYDFTYTIDTSTAIRQNALSVLIRAIPINKPKPLSLFSGNFLTGKMEPSLLPKKIQQLGALKKDIKFGNKNSQISESNSDFTTAVSNDNPLQKIVKKDFVFAKASTLADTDQQEPIMQRTTLEQSENNDSYQALAMQMILDEKADPSDLEDTYVVTSEKAFSGVVSEKLVNKKIINFNFREKLIQKNVIINNPVTAKDVSPEVIVPIVRQRGTNFVTVTKRMIFESGILSDKGEFIIEFKLMGSNGLPLETVSKKVEHGQNVKTIQTPTVAPKVSSTTLMSKNILEIKQMDPNATSVKIYRKHIKKTLKIEESNYEFVDRVFINPGELANYEDLIGNASDIIYRIIPYGSQNQPSTTYTNIVVPKYYFNINTSRDNKMVHAGVIGQIVSKGIRIDVVGIPPGVAAIKVVVRDKTLFERQWRTIKYEITNQEYAYADDFTKTYSFIDVSSNLKRHHIYEYCCVLIYPNGNEVLVNTCETMEYIPFTFGIVETVISDSKVVSTEKGDIDITFSINSTINSTQKTILKKLLEKQNFFQQFSAEVEDEKEELDKLLAHSVRRVDLLNGESSYFPVLIEDNFSDFSLRKAANISPLKAGRTYRYIVTALLRDPTTVFDNNLQTFTNLSNIAVSFSPKKFKHPIVSQFGSTVNNTSIKRNHSKNEFEFGNVANYVAVDLSLEQTKPRIFNPYVKKFNSNINIIKWNLEGAKELIDHFLIVSNRFGSEEIIGKTHNFYNSNVIEYIDKNFSSKSGSVKYKIVPIFKDYSQGPSIMTEEVI